MADGVRVGEADGVRVGVADGVRVGVRVGVGLAEGRRSDFRLLGLSMKVNGSTTPPMEETPTTAALEIELPVLTVEEPGTVKSFQVAAPNLPFEPRRIVATPPWEAPLAFVVIGIRYVPLPLLQIPSKWVRIVLPAPLFGKAKERKLLKALVAEL